VWGWLRRLAAVAVLAVVVARLGTGPFLTGVRSVSPEAILAALAITAVTTVCSAWRWQTVLRGLGGSLPLRAAVAAYYRSQFLNSALPGGVVGDVHRGVRNGLDAGDLGRGVRAVVWERVAGQVVFVVVAVGVLLGLDSPVRGAVGWVVALALGVLLLSFALGARVWSRLRVWRRATADVRSGLLARRAWPVVVVSSLVVAAGHTGTFLVAVSVTGSAASPAQLLPLATLALLSMSLPLSVGGWGPREGVAAWAFAAAGLGAASGVAAATAYGVMAFVATIPGALVLLGEWCGRRFAVRVARRAELAEAAR
jgi:uncharacterized membrane protein YbhN (UPF0104 family)